MALPSKARQRLNESDERLLDHVVHIGALYAKNGSSRSLHRPADELEESVRRLDLTGSRPTRETDDGVHRDAFGRLTCG